MLNFSLQCCLALITLDLVIYGWCFSMSLIRWRSTLTCKYPLNCSIFIRVQPVPYEIKNNAWVTLNIDFLSWGRQFDNDCWIASWVTEKNSTKHTIPLKQFSITDFTIVTEDGLFWPSIVTSPQLIRDVIRMWGAGIVTSYLLIVFARSNWHKGNIHSWITALNIDFSPPSIHGLVCKKSDVLMLM